MANALLRHAFSTVGFPWERAWHVIVFPIDVALWSGKLPPQWHVILAQILRYQNWERMKENLMITNGSLKLVINRNICLKAGNWVLYFVRGTSSGNKFKSFVPLIRILDLNLLTEEVSRAKYSTQFPAFKHIFIFITFATMLILQQVLHHVKENWRCELVSMKSVYFPWSNARRYFKPDAKVSLDGDVPLALHQTQSGNVASE